jgi:serine/threonine protein phosphatase 1
MNITESTYIIPHFMERGREVFAIGDIHGRADLFEGLLTRAASISRLGDRTIVQTGDLIDRGPESLRAIELAMNMRELSGSDEVVNLMGNHEQMLGVAFGNDHETYRFDAFENWTANGGSAVRRELMGEDWQVSYRDETRSMFGDKRLSFIRGMRSHFQVGDFIFVHAGISPNVKLNTFLNGAWDRELRFIDEDRHWGWVRHPFLVSRSHRGKFVVHGHTPPDGLRRTGADTVSKSRINLDLWSFKTGRGRMARFYENQVTVFDVYGDPE